MQGLIWRSTSLSLILELYPLLLIKLQIDSSELLNTLAALGFEIYAIEEPAGSIVPLTSWHSRELLFTLTPKYVNLFAQKKGGDLD